MKILIVDDEPPARHRLTELVNQAGLGEVVGQAANGREALAATESAEPDLVLLDIRMPGMDGLEVARHLAILANPPAVIFTTAYDDHALAAFETHAVGYLLKPIRLGRLRAALERAARPTRAQLSDLRGPEPRLRSRTHLSANLTDKLTLVPIEEVRFLRAEHKYVTARFSEGELLLEDSLAALEAEFGDRFLRVHRNALVAREHVRALEKDAGGRVLVRLADVAERVEVSRRNAAAVRRALRNL